MTPSATFAASKMRASGNTQVKLTRIVGWAAALGVGAINGWLTRYSMNQDGVSYLDIADAYWRGDWHNAINAYWSPLYSWILGLFVSALRPSPAWEYPLVHVANFLIYLSALACFEYLLTNLIAYRTQKQASFPKKLLAFPEMSLRSLGYAVFVSCAVILIGLGPVNPDLCVLALVCLASAFLVRIEAHAASCGTYAAFGATLGVSYLAKGAMFPLAIVFLVVAFAAGRISKNSLQRSGLSALCFLMVVTPFIIAMSYAKGRLTLGDSGKINYAICVTGNDWYIPLTQDFDHPVNVLSNSPLIYEFARPVAGTYPLWYDLSYWHQGVKTEFNRQGQLAAVFEGLHRYRLVFLSTFMQLNFTLVGLILLALSPSLLLRSVFTFWPLWTVAMVGLLMYALVVVEFRYVAPFVLLLWLASFSSVTVANPEKVQGLMCFIAAGALLTTIILATIWIGLSRTPEAAQYPAAALAMERLGFAPGDQLAVIGTDPAGRDGAYVARLGHMKIIAELRDPNAFWNADDKSQHRVESAFADAGARAILTYRPSSIAASWIKLGATDYSIHWLRKPN